MKFSERINNLPAYIFCSHGDRYDGFYECRDEATLIAEKADELISKLLNALCDRNADDLVDKLKEEYGL